MKFVFVFLLAAGSVFAAPVPKEHRRPRTDLELLQGEWVITDCITNNQPKPRDIGVRYIVNGNQIRLVRPESTTDSTITLNETEKTYSWETVWGTWVGRYQIEGNKLLMAGGRGNFIPSEVKPGPTHEYDVLKRDK